MKRIFIFLFTVFVFGGVVLGQDKDHKEKVPGFRFIKWGAKLDSVYKNGEKVEFVQVKGQDKPEVPNVYKIPDDDMTIGAAQLKQIHYYFNEENEFYSVRIIGSKEYIEDMSFILRHKFGSPMQVEKNGSTRTQQWNIDNVEFTLVNSFDSPDFILTISSNWEKIESYRKNTSVKDF